MRRALVVGCGLSGAVVARELAEDGYKVNVLEKRDHIGGNMYDYVDEHGILIHKYGPHTFHTNNKELFDYICRFGEWKNYKLTCGAEINGICTPTPFNYQTIDDFYSDDDAQMIKREIEKEFPGGKKITVIDALNSNNTAVKGYAQFLFDNDYSLYTAKQWGVSPNEIDPSVLKRVPLRLSYETGYFDDKYQVMPRVSYMAFFENLLKHDNIEIELNTDFLKKCRIDNKSIYYKNELINYPVVYTGALDELFGLQAGKLPYRSLRFELKYENVESKQNMPVVAYPQAPDYVRIIEYRKLPVQNVKGTTYVVEYSLPYKSGEKNEPYYPILTENSKNMYLKYKALANNISNLYICGRLGNYQYYNMDQALDEALKISKKIITYSKL